MSGNGEYGGNVGGCRDCVESVGEEIGMGTRREKN